MCPKLCSHDELKLTNSTTGLFQGDQDLDIRGETEHAMGLTNDGDDEYDVDKELQSTAFRDKLNAGLCDKLFKEFRSKENTFWIPDRKMYTVILAAMVMQSGAKVSDDNMQHLREIVPRIHSSPGYAWPLNDEGFRDPGKVQFLAALEFYKPGTPRTFCELRLVPSSPARTFAKMGPTDRYQPAATTVARFRQIWARRCISARDARWRPTATRWALPCTVARVAWMENVSNWNHTGLPEGSLEGSQAFLLRPQESSHDDERLKRRDFCYWGLQVSEQETAETHARNGINHGQILLSK